MIKAGRKYATRSGDEVLITSRHPIWPNIFAGRPAKVTGSKRLFWNKDGDYLHRNGEPHQLDILADTGRGIIE